ncbi:conserved hypothetical protein [Neospora caninum Liverpool]|uniref:Uncharacterized protein n=1 Tax=Neospora caninum (strain Liverpool) TaxID=572307 RepID=F0VIP2_NEOCL|nr:conserved hypothetical protein [Neospora caninum Liverpool]CBZ53603.1 conserved hypothetical protein [Neospora caninum Liverpool]CEL67593.1 TPA: hypothetical protein BN1204_033900 [Neospora caninum Liverpool]|eukprot:XP_003883635.1 conserved hypothetical protein [Neospora caninum Liverpool]
MADRPGARCPSPDEGEAGAVQPSSSHVARESEALRGLGGFWTWSLEELGRASFGPAAETLAWRDVSQIFNAWSEVREKLKQRGAALATRLRRLLLFLPDKKDSKAGQLTPVTHRRCLAQNESGVRDLDEGMGAHAEEGPRQREVRLVEVLEHAQEETDALQLFDRFHELLQIRCRRERPAVDSQTLDRRDGEQIGRRAEDELDERRRLPGLSTEDSSPPVQPASEARLRRQFSKQLESSRQAADADREPVGESREEDEKQTFASLAVANGEAGADAISDLEHLVKCQMVAFFSPTQDAPSAASPKSNTHSLQERPGQPCPHVLCKMNQVPGSLAQMLQIQVERIQEISSDMTKLVQDFLETKVSVARVGSSSKTHEDRGAAAANALTREDKLGKGQNKFSLQARSLSSQGFDGGSGKIPNVAGGSICVSHFQCLLQLRLLCEAGAQSVLTSGQRPEEVTRLPVEGGQEQSKQAGKAAEPAENAEPLRLQAERVRSALLETSGASAAILASAGGVLAFLRTLQVACSSGQLWEEESEDSAPTSERTRRFAEDFDKLLDRLPTSARALRAASHLCATRQVWPISETETLKPKVGSAV